MEKELRIIISGGGTGGHIFPAVSIANAIIAVSYTHLDVYKRQGFAGSSRLQDRKNQLSRQLLRILPIGRAEVQYDCFDPETRFARFGRFDGR